MLTGMHKLPKLEESEVKKFLAFCKQFKHYAKVYSLTQEQESWYLPLALYKNILGELMRLVPNL